MIDKLIAEYKAKFGSAALPNLIGLDRETIIDILQSALESGKPAPSNEPPPEICI